MASKMKVSRTTIAKYLKDYEEVKSSLMGYDEPKIKEETICSPNMMH